MDLCFSPRVNNKETVNIGESRVHLQIIALCRSRTVTSSRSPPCLLIKPENPQHKEHIPHSGASFRTGTSQTTSTEVDAVGRVLSYKSEIVRIPVLLLLDVMAAFPSADRHYLMTTLEDTDFPPGAINLTKGDL